MVRNCLHVCVHVQLFEKDSRSSLKHEIFSKVALQNITGNIRVLSEWFPKRFSHWMSFGVPAGGCGFNRDYLIDSIREWKAEAYSGPILNYANSVFPPFNHRESILGLHPNFMRSNKNLSIYFSKSLLHSNCAGFYEIC